MLESMLLSSGLVLAGQDTNLRGFCRLARLGSVLQGKQVEGGGVSLEARF